MCPNNRECNRTHLQNDLCWAGRHNSTYILAITLIYSKKWWTRLRALWKMNTYSEQRPVRLSACHIRRSLPREFFRRYISVCFAVDSKPIWIKRISERLLANHNKVKSETDFVCPVYTGRGRSQREGSRGARSPNRQLSNFYGKTGFVGTYGTRECGFNTIELLIIFEVFRVKLL